MGVPVYQQVCPLLLHGLCNGNTIHIHDLSRFIGIGLLTLLPHLSPHFLSLGERFLQDVLLPLVAAQ